MSGGWPGRLRGSDGEDESPAIRTRSTVPSKANTAHHPMATPPCLARVICLHRPIRHRTTVTTTSGRLHRVPGMYGEFSAM